MQSETVSSPSQLLAQNLPQRRPRKQVGVLFERGGGGGSSCSFGYW